MNDKLKRIIFLLLSLSIIVVICIIVGFFGQNEDNDIIDRIVGVIAIVSGIGSIIMGISSVFSASLDNVREYYSTGDNETMISARRMLYNYRYIKLKYNKTIYDEGFDQWVKETVDSGDPELNATTRQEILDATSLISDFFQMWGLLQYKGFLPIWVFETASGYSVIKLYEAIDDIVTQKRLNNPFYAEQFQNLCIRINSRYKKAILECRKSEMKHMRELGVENMPEVLQLHNF